MVGFFVVKISITTETKGGVMCECAILVGGRQLEHRSESQLVNLDAKQEKVPHRDNSLKCFRKVKCTKCSCFPVK